MHIKAPKYVSMYFIKFLYHTRYFMVKQPLWILLFSKAHWLIPSLPLSAGVCGVYVITVILYIVLCLGSISLHFSMSSLIVMVTDWTVFLHRLSDVRVTDFIALYKLSLLMNILDFLTEYKAYCLYFLLPLYCFLTKIKMHDSILPSILNQQQVCMSYIHCSFIS